MDERLLVTGLEPLPSVARAAFAASCAEQLMPYYDAFRHDTSWDPESTLRHTLNRVWGSIADRHPIRRTEFAALYRQIQELAPDVDAHASSWTGVALNACVSVARAAECACTGDLTAAVTAATYTYQGFLEALAENDREVEDDSDEARQVVSGMVGVLEILKSFRDQPINIEVLRSVRFLADTRGVYR